MMQPLNPHAPASGGRLARREALLSAAVTSQIAGLAMAVVVMAVFTVFLGRGPLYPVQVIGSVAFGERALQGVNFAAILAGLVFHQGLALAWGVVYGFAAGALSVRTAGKAALLGLLVAAISMIDTYVIVPPVMNALHGTDIWRREVPLFWNWAAHAVFGLSFGLYPAVLARLAGNRL
jgi:hypothetical protein